MLWKESFEQVRARVNARLGYGKLLRLARQTGISVEHLSKAWRGERSLSFTMAYRIAKTAGVTMEELYKTIAAPKGSFCRKELAYWDTRRKQKVVEAQYWSRREKQLAKIANELKRTPTR